MVFHKDLSAEILDSPTEPLPIVADWIARYRELAPAAYEDERIAVFDLGPSR